MYVWRHIHATVALYFSEVHRCNVRCWHQLLLRSKASALILFCWNLKLTSIKKNKKKKQKKKTFLHWWYSSRKHTYILLTPLNPLSYSKTGVYRGTYYFFLFLLKNINCGYSLEPSRWGGSNEYPQSMFRTEIWKYIRVFIWKLSVFAGEISIYLNKCVFVMSGVKILRGNLRKRKVWHVRPTNTQISLHIREVWSEFSLFPWGNFASLVVQNAYSENPDQTMRIRRIIVGRQR